ncbi:hypothetical protein BDV93DRAFT_527263 [Ceratobasidium sp. AG-I]|nr:hypothetical protein BDV93DRAFT_527263 [Ceratobasidium sp. AG-I]
MIVAIERGSFFELVRWVNRANWLHGVGRWTCRNTFIKNMKAELEALEVQYSLSNLSPCIRTPSPHHDTDARTLSEIRGICAQTGITAPRTWIELMDGSALRRGGSWV